MTSLQRTANCQYCRKLLLQSFIASVGGQPIPATFASQRGLFSTTRRREIQTYRIKQPKDIQRPYVSRAGAQNVTDRSEVQHSPYTGEDATIFPKTISDEDAPGAIDGTKPPSPRESASTPWYLEPEHHPPPQPSSPIGARQRLPPIPSHPPPILQPLLTHISVELGMDDLSLLDLRSLDPPPALGANLLMIVGTARSEKHLHVSADKLCRWLRSDPFYLTPFADGLLGRNELKLKLRRRAKRLRLMTGIGVKAAADTELEEGIRTGWVCVNVGRVEGGELPDQAAGVHQRDAQVVGFGTRVGGSSIVVQLMTEEKRGEIDLERLWTGILNRSRREREEASTADEEALPGRGIGKQTSDSEAFDSKEKARPQK
ncbi:hypothetical protein M433DRAFT_158009 [Acidomyces richmondensis BFW]|nr:MAG: hypothetical protein FE78DRAFT_84854 [Acidomyces sp. 'richmondensis']KYG42332.1 hypothetical protein M433DRAFT_158009 [Acidomyces richmondensis BFW]